jgi:hypothetical protein
MTRLMVTVGAIEERIVRAGGTEELSGGEDQTIEQVDLGVVQCVTQQHQRAA